MTTSYPPVLSARQLKAFMVFQQNEITGYYMYTRLAKRIRDKNNASVMERIAREEKSHYEIWKKYTGKDISPGKMKLFGYFLLTRILGIAASFSRAASDYLSKKADDTGKNAGKSAAYTGLAYLFTVALLIVPYLIFTNYLLCLGLTLTIAILVIFVFNYYISVAKDLDFRRRFTEMAVISLGVSALTFGISFLIKKALGVDV